MYESIREGLKITSSWGVSDLEKAGEYWQLCWSCLELTLQNRPWSETSVTAMFLEGKTEILFATERPKTTVLMLPNFVFIFFHSFWAPQLLLPSDLKFRSLEVTRTSFGPSAQYQLGIRYYYWGRTEERDLLEKLWPISTAK